MKKIIATLGVAFIFSTVQAQTTKSVPAQTRPEKNNHGTVVSTAAHQTYPQSEKGKFISRIARSKSRIVGAKKQPTVNPKKLSTSKPQNPKAKGLQINRPARPVPAQRRILVQRPTSKGQSVRLNRPNPVRRPVGNGRFTQVGRG
ncbi:hypothetical protein AAE02nite_28820 [Adhaeribacter aerolatus]|uniref:Uncharacterized protein n=1 Tax=Adhaeribacter aerolatus TaxID=670289 RepID=A0A512AZS7_9BACT|nr:hypothetical protein [Adhaeribacter aerolatus]GEO05218.1 hypothetical protein AAE02nite_28820 [Adhaeribacter aerolatus]